MLRGPIGAINTLMLLSIPFMGHHYVADMIAGTAITVIVVIAYRIATTRAVSAASLSIRLSARAAPPERPVISRNRARLFFSRFASHVTR